MAAIASHTQRMRLGLHVTPLSRRRPWKVAREIVSLDHLSGGRMVMGVGLGDFKGKEFDDFGEVSDPLIRAEMLDEGLEIVSGLQSSEVYRFKGQHYEIRRTVFNPKPVQQSRVPIWVGGKWPNKRPFRRAARWDGAAPVHRTKDKKELIAPSEVRELSEYIKKHRDSDVPFDIALSGILPGKTPFKDREILTDLEKAGGTWWLEFVYNSTGSYKANLARIRRGPPG
jgi:alkanesulfonate monooxygenase SsuD/methylene tetrahydromethanopterin reductase-like flavin-dependent oxidoreductase (luciferase family)